MDWPKIIGMYRIKNVERWIEKSLKSVSEICEEIVVLDDGSTDNTLKICKNFPNVVDVHHQSDLPWNDTRDKNTLLQMALKRNPDFIFTMDGDEIIMPNSSDILFKELEILYPDYYTFEFQELYIWDKPNQYRYDGVYSNTWPRKLLRMKNQPKDLQFKGQTVSGKGDNPHTPQNAFGWEKSVRSRVKILHYGYYDEKLRKEKFNFYNKLLGPNEFFDGYKHIISGKGKLSGPKGMEFRTLPTGRYIADISSTTEIKNE